MMMMMMSFNTPRLNIWADGKLIRILWTPYFTQKGSFPIVAPIASWIKMPKHSWDDLKLQEVPSVLTAGRYWKPKTIQLGDHIST